MSNTKSKVQSNGEATIQLRNADPQSCAGKLWSNLRRRVQEPIITGAAALLLTLSPIMVSCGGGSSGGGAGVTTTPPPAVLSLSVSPSSVQLSAQGYSPSDVSIAITGAKPNDKINLYDGPQSSSYLVGTYTAGSNGSVNTSLAVNSYNPVPGTGLLQAYDSTAALTSNQQPMTYTLNGNSINWYALTVMPSSSNLSIITDDILITTLAASSTALVITNSNVPNVYLAQNQAIEQLDPATNQIAASSLALSNMIIDDALFSSDGKMLYVSGALASNVTLGNLVSIDVSKNAIANQFSLPFNSPNLAISPNNTYLYASNGEWNSSTSTGTILNTQTNTTIETAPINTGFKGAFTSDSTKIYIGAPASPTLVNTTSNLYVVDAATGQITGTITGISGNGGTANVDIGPVVFTPDGSKAYVGVQNFNGTNLVASYVSIIDTSSGAITGTLQEGFLPDRLTMGPDGNLWVENVYYTNNNTQTEVDEDVIDTSTDTIISKIPLDTFSGAMQNLDDGSFPVMGFRTMRFSSDGSEGSTVGAAVNNTTTATEYIVDVASRTLKAKATSLSGEAGAVAPLDLTSAQ